MKENALSLVSGMVDSSVAGPETMAPSPETMKSTCTVCEDWYCRGYEDPSYCTSQDEITFRITLIETLFAPIFVALMAYWALKPSTITPGFGAIYGCISLALLNGGFILTRAIKESRGNHE